MPSRVARKIAELRKSQGWTQAVLAKKAGTSQANINRIEKGQEPRLDLLERIAGALGVSRSQLFGEEKRKPETRKPVSVPIVSRASANPDAYIEYETFEGETIDLSQLIAFEITDESMMPLAWPGQKVLCKPEARIKDGDLVVAKHKKGGQAFFKRYFQNKEANSVILESINPVSPKKPMIITEDQLSYIYKVIGVVFE